MSPMLTAKVMAALLMPLLVPQIPSGLRSAAAVTLAASDQSSVFPDSARVKAALNFPLELHNLLMVASNASERPPEFAAMLAAYDRQIADYKDARRVIVEPLAWRYINDAILEGPDMVTIVARASGAPASLGAPDAEGVRKILTALGAAWPRFEKADLDVRRVSLQKMRSRIEKLTALFEPKVMPVIYTKLALSLPDAPVTVYPVIDALDSGVVGRTTAGYYLVIPTTRRPDMVILETLIHEMTHLLDSIQPADQKSILRRVRAAATANSRRDVEEMLHGLVTYNSGVVLQRFGKPDYTPLVNASPAMGEKIAKYRAVFDGPWSEYLSGKIDETQVIKALVGAVGGASKAQASSSRN